MSVFRFKHWAPAGDLTACMPGLRQIWRETGKKAVIMQRLNVIGEQYPGAISAIFDEKGNAVCMSAQQWEMLKPLLEAQEYIDHCEIWEGQPFDLDGGQLKENAYTPSPNGSLYHWQQLILPQMATFFGEPWLTIPPSSNVFNDIVISEHVIINRTERYTNPLITYYFLKDFQDRLIFAGTENERQMFCKEWNLEIPRLLINNFVELAQALQSCKFFIGNQSLCYHICEGMAKTRLLEICPRMANVWPSTPNGFPFMHQVNFEYYFNKLINQ